MRNADMPAMPGHEYGADGNLAKGLTKREHFAALAMQGLSANPSLDIIEFDADRIASIALQQADALLAELERTP